MKESSIYFQIRFMMKMEKKMVDFQLKQANGFIFLIMLLKVMIIHRKM
jgi:hypothetical protein